MFFIIIAILFIIIGLDNMRPYILFKKGRIKLKQNGFSYYFRSDPVLCIDEVHKILTSRPKNIYLYWSDTPKDGYTQIIRHSCVFVRHNYFINGKYHSVYPILARIVNKMGGQGYLKLESI